MLAEFHFAMFAKDPGFERREPVAPGTRLFFYAEVFLREYDAATSQTPVTEITSPWPVSPLF